MKKWLSLAAIASLTTLLGACAGKSAPAPNDFTATAGDGRVTVAWTPSSGVEYWLFMATDSSLTTTNWATRSNSYAFQNATAPRLICGLGNGVAFWFTINGRVDHGPGGPGAPAISATPRAAGSAGNWTANGAIAGNPTLNGAGFAAMTTCTDPTRSVAYTAGGMFAAVGAAGAILSSTDGKTWTSRTTPSGFTTDLYAVAGYAGNLDTPANPALKWVAVGDGGASVVSSDGVTWTTGVAYDKTKPALRGVINAGATFLAVGDTGTIVTGSDGITWTTRGAGVTTANLRGIAAGSAYVAVGDGGTILKSADFVTWTAQVSGTTENLRSIVYSAAYGFVAVGDKGAVLTSNDGITWTVRTAVTGTPDLVSVASTSQFVAVDGSGNAYVSTDGGATWSAAIATGSSSLNHLTSAGFGFVGVGGSGTTVYSF